MTIDLHNHVRTWSIVALVISVIVFLYVHESRTEAAQQAQAALISKQAEEQQAEIQQQIKAIQEQADNQVAVLNKQITQVQTVAQAIAAIRTSVPSVTVTPIVTSPATVTEPAKTTAEEKAIGTAPVATITGDDLKALATESLTCKAQAVQFNSCQKEAVLKDHQIESLDQQIDSLKKIKVEPAWKRTMKTIGSVLLGAAIGHAI